jgi:S-adenosylmethionine:tRNA ribosyltransferase-isomerase
MNPVHISDYEYDLPSELIAQQPLPERDRSRLLVVHRDGRPLEHRTFADFGDCLRAGDLLVVNDTRVLPARFDATREGFPGHIEVLLVRPRGGPLTWEALTRPARRLTPGTRLQLAGGAAQAVVTAEGEEGLRVLEFPPDTDVPALMKAHGHVPLPPYISRADEPADRERYQTVFARRDGAIAAPTAGLHFTEARLAELAAAGVTVAPVTLHVGPGTFRPVMTEDPRLHVMESEWYEVPEATAAAFKACRARGGRVVACGTTVVRTLEAAAVAAPGAGGAGGPGAPAGPAGPEQRAPAPAGFRLEPGAGWADLFIYEPYVFHAVDALITNFHLPRSTLLMLVCAFGGGERIRRAYRAAVREKYRFYSYGDAMLID